MANAFFETAVTAVSTFLKQHGLVPPATLKEAQDLQVARGGKIVTEQAALLQTQHRLQTDYEIALGDLEIQRQSLVRMKGDAERAHQDAVIDLGEKAARSESKFIRGVGVVGERAAEKSNGTLNAEALKAIEILRGEAVKPDMVHVNDALVELNYIADAHPLAHTAVLETVLELMQNPVFKDASDPENKTQLARNTAIEMLLETVQDYVLDVENAQQDAQIVISQLQDLIVNGAIDEKWYNEAARTIAVIGLDTPGAAPRALKAFRAIEMTVATAKPDRVDIPGIVESFNCFSIETLSTPQTIIAKYSTADAKANFESETGLENLSVQPKYVGVAVDEKLRERFATAAVILRAVDRMKVLGPAPKQATSGYVAMDPIPPENENPFQGAHIG